MASRDPRDATWFRQVLGQYPTGVSVVTGQGSDGTPTGLVVGSFTSVSLDPPLIAFLPDRNSTSWPKIRPSDRFCVNILAHDQEPVCRRFATPGGDKFAGVPWRPAGSGSPIIEHVVAWIDCELDVVHDAGDHEIVIGRVLELDVERPSEPLLFFRGGYGRFAPLSLALGEAGLQRELRLVDRARPAMEALARDLHAQCVAWALVGDELVLLASAGTAERHGVPSSMIGARLPAIPPVGATWMAYASPTRLEAWLAHLPADARQEQRERVAQVRARGYTVALRGPQLPEVQELVEHDGLDRAGALLRSLPLDPLAFDPDDAPQVATVSVPVFDSSGAVQLLLGVHGLRRLTDRQALERCVERLQAAARTVTGSPPPVPAP